MTKTIIFDILHGTRPKFFEFNVVCKVQNSEKVEVRH